MVGLGCSLGARAWDFGPWPCEDCAEVTSPLLSFFFGWALKALGLLRDAQSAERLASSLLPAALPLMVLSAQTARHGLGAGGKAPRDLV